MPLPDMHVHVEDKRRSTRNLRTAFLLNLGFTVLEVVGGLLTNSMAILSDALHDLGDSLSLAMAWYLQSVSDRGADNRFSYGYGRFSLLGALITAIVLIGGSLFILSEAIPRMLDPEPTNAPGMIAIAFVGIGVNGYAVWRLRSDKGMNAQTVAWHLLEDVLGWVAVLIVGVTLLFSDFYVLDPVLSILVTLYVLFNVVKNVRETLAIFLQATPGSVDLEDISRRLESLPNVRSTHHTHVWSLDGEHHVLTTHLVVPDETSRDEIIRLKSDSKAVVGEMKLDHVTVEVEFESEDCGMRG